MYFRMDYKISLTFCTDIIPSWTRQRSAGVRGASTRSRSSRCWSTTPEPRFPSRRPCTANSGRPSNGSPAQLPRRPRPRGTSTWRPRLSWRTASCRYVVSSSRPLRIHGATWRRRWWGPALEGVEQCGRTGRPNRRGPTPGSLQSLSAATKPCDEPSARRACRVKPEESCNCWLLNCAPQPNDQDKSLKRWWWCEVIRWAAPCQQHHRSPSPIEICFNSMILSVGCWPIAIMQCTDEQTYIYMHYYVPY